MAAVARATEEAKPGARPADAVLRLTLDAFRCYDRLRVEPGAGPIVLCGPNGAGKTALLEAVSMLAPGRGLRRAAPADLARRPRDE
ncbi:MAG: AAA family ATPase, partial [Alphaproteobacteria bacterium]